MEMFIVSASGPLGPLPWPSVHHFPLEERLCDCTVATQVELYAYLLIE